MIAKSIVQRWDTSPEMRKRGLVEMAKILVSPTATSREKTAAFKAILAAEAQNQTDEHKVIDVRVATRHDKLDAIARDLGIDPALIAAAEDEAAGGVAGTESGDAASPPA